MIERRGRFAKEHLGRAHVALLRPKGGPGAAEPTAIDGVQPAELPQAPRR